MLVTIPILNDDCCICRVSRNDRLFAGNLSLNINHYELLVSERHFIFDCEQIQANIADTFKRQSEAIARRRTTAKATAAAIVRKAHGNFRTVSRQRGRGRGRRGGRNRRSVRQFL